jgi:hypothetical protein
MDTTEGGRGIFVGSCGFTSSSCIAGLVMMLIGGADGAWTVSCAVVIGGEEVLGGDFVAPSNPSNKSFETSSPSMVALESQNSFVWK